MLAGVWVLKHPDFTQPPPLPRASAALGLGFPRFAPGPLSPPCVWPLCPEGCVLCLAGWGAQSLGTGRRLLLPPRPGSPGKAGLRGSSWLPLAGRFTPQPALSRGTRCPAGKCRRVIKTCRAAPPSETDEQSREKVRRTSRTRTPGRDTQPGGAEILLEGPLCTRRSDLQADHQVLLTLRDGSSLILLLHLLRAGCTLTPTPDSGYHVGGTGGRSSMAREREGGGFPAPPKLPSKVIAGPPPKVPVLRPPPAAR